MIVDDVITAGTAVREAHKLITAAGAEVSGLVISLDRQEIGQGSRSAVQELEQSLKMPVAGIIRLEDIIDMLEDLDDVQNVYTNADFTEEVMQQLV